MMSFFLARGNENEQVKEDAIGRTCSTRGREEECLKGLVIKPEGKKPLRKPRRRWEVNIKWMSKKY
jgi:hypothetical protein